jgi:hypothetical protein
VDVPISLWRAVQRIATGTDAWPPRTRSRAEIFVRTAIGEKLAPLLLAASDLPAAVAAHVDDARAKLRDTMQRQSAALDRCTVQLTELLRGERFALFKGAEYRYRLYPSRELRAMTDINILVPRARFGAVNERFRAAGIREHLSHRPAARATTHHQVSFYAETLFSVQHSFVQRPRHAIDYDAIWKRVVPVDGELLRISDLDAFLAHCLQFAIGDGSVELVRYADLWLMLQRDPELPLRAVDTARAWRMERAVFATLRQARLVMPELATPQVEAAMQQLLRARVRRFLDTHVLPDPLQRGRETQLWRTLCLVDDWRHRLGYCVTNAGASLAGWVIGSARAVTTR